MDFLDPKKKRAHHIRLIVGYCLVSIALAMGTLVLVLLAYGYDLNRKTGQVIQNSVVFVGSHPVAADVFVNGRAQGRTDSRLVLPAGSYSIELKQAGYRSWTRNFSLQGGSIERLDYPMLFPLNLKTGDVELFGSLPAFTTQSPDRNWLLLAQPGQFQKFEVMDLSNNNTSTTTLTLPPNLVTASSDSTQSWQTPEWSSDNRHVLLKHQFGGKDEFIMVDRENPAASFNVNRLFGITPSQVVLRDKRFDQLYIYQASGGIVQIGDVKAKTLTLLLSRVLAFKAHDDKTILYVSEESDKPKQVSLKLFRDGTTYTLRDLPSGDNYLLEVARYDSRWYMVAAAQSENRVYIYRDPEAALKQRGSKNALLPAIVLTIDKPAAVAFSENARFVSVQNGSHFAVYDAATDRRYYYGLTLPIDNNHQATWMDGNRLTLISQARVLVFDFDGTNQQILAAADPAFRPFFDRDYKWLYTLGPSLTVAGRFAMTRSDLVAK